MLIPKRDMYTFLEWKANKELNTIFDRLTATYKAQWVHSVPDELRVPEEEWQKTTSENLDKLWKYTEENGVIVLTQYIGESINRKVEIPRIIGDKRVELDGIGNIILSGITHCRVEEDDKKPKVKLRNGNISIFGSIYNNGEVRYLDFSGLEANITKNPSLLRFKLRWLGY